MADPIARAINTFAALKGMEYQGQQAERQQLLDEESREERRYNRGMAQKAEERAQQTFDLNLQAHEENADWNRQQRTRQVQEWSEADIAKARGEADNILLSAVKAAEASGTDLDVPGLLAQLEPVQHGLKKKLAALYDPQAVEARTGATLELLRQMRTGQFDQDSLVTNANLAFADELDARGQKYGAKQVRFARLLPSPQGDGFVAEAEITRADGSTYRAPLTVNGGTADDGDHEVKVFKAEQVAPYLVGKLQTLQGAKAYLEAKGKIKKEEIKYETVTDAKGRVWAVNPKNPKDKQLVTDAVKPEKGDGEGGSGDGLPAEAKMVEFYKQKLGIPYEDAVDLVKTGKTRPEELAIKIYTEMKSNNLDEVPDEELRQQALESAQFFFDTFSKTKGKRGGMAPGAPKELPMMQSHASGVPPAVGEKPAGSGPLSARMDGDTVTVDGKAYPVKDGMVMIDGKRYRVNP